MYVLWFLASSMAINFSLLLLVLSGTLTTKKMVSATVFTLTNHCPYTVWPGTLSGNGPALANGGFTLPRGASANITAPPGWSGRFWARTRCDFDGAGNGHCATGNCAGGLRCAGTGGVPPATLAEFTVQGGGGMDMDFYDVSLVDGYNVGVRVTPTDGGTGDCRPAGCSRDLNSICPRELRVTDPAEEGVVACKSACMAFNAPEYCCTGDYGTPATCRPTRYSEVFKSACPTAYSYAYDDASGTRTCSGSDYLITFCPSIYDLRDRFK